MIEFWFDFASSYSYPAAMRIEHLAERDDVTVVWRPFLLGAIFNKHGWNDSPFNSYPAKGRHMWRDLQRVCDDLNLPLKKPTIFPKNGLLAARIATRYATEPWVPRFIRAVYSANFEFDQDISSLEVISHCLVNTTAGVDQIIKEANTLPAKQLFKKQTDEAFERGIFGAPSFLVEDELFWGNDRLEKALSWSKPKAPRELANHKRDDKN